MSQHDEGRRRGSATVTIADLSRPRAGVETGVPGFAIGSPAWPGSPLAGGGFASGSAGAGGHLRR